MPSVSTIVQQRQHRRQIERRNPAGRIGLTFSVLLSLGLALAVFASALVYTTLLRDLPSLKELPLLLEPPNGFLLQPTRLYDRTGQHVILTLENPAAAGHQYLPVDEAQPVHLSPALVKATLALTDPTFWKNPGYTLKGWSQGTHPTIAQRLVADFLLWDEPAGVRHNLRERLLAAQITARYGRQKVLEWYLNSVYYGRWIYGADAAARVYFGKSAAELNLAEAAVLAAVAEAPALNPLDAPQAAIERQRLVIDAMLLQGLITTDEAVQATQTPLNFYPAVEQVNIAPAFTNLVLEQLSADYPLSRIERGGLRIITSLDYDLQLQVDCATQIDLVRLGDVQTSLTAADGTPCQAARLLPTLPLGDQLSPVGLNASALVLDPHTGQVLALVGESTPSLDLTQLPGHPAGSLLTPFIYLTALTRGMSPASLVWDIPSTNVSISNLDRQFHGPLRLRTALANDYVAPAAQLLTIIGPENAWLTARQFGLSSLPSAAALLPGGEISLLEAGQAFGVFANQGVLTGVATEAASQGQEGTLAPVVVLRLEDLDGRAWVEVVSQTRPVVTTQLTYLITHMLSDETARWPTLGHPNPLEVGRPAAAKIGRTADGSDAWTLGYTTQMVVGVWMGYSEPITGSIPTQIPAGLWHAILQYASRDLPSEGWSVPTGISKVSVCDPSGMLPTVYCPSVVTELFMAGSEPVQSDTLYQAFQINRETGHLATVFTPPELVEERVYLVVPSQAVEWAQQAGLPTPPDAYDVIYTPVSVSPDVQISFPGMFAYVHGKVTFVGSAGGEGFTRYRLQLGAGLNPREWFLVGGDVSTPVKDGLLGEWDTQGLSGLYAVELLVVRKDQRVEIAVTQVTVDNQPPEVDILNPLNGQSFSSEQNPDVLLQATASDNLALAKLEFYVDDQLVSTLPQPPFAVVWKASMGEHTLRVQALDLAGNTTEASLTFVVR